MWQGTLQSSLVHMWEGLGTKLVAIWPWALFWNKASIPTLVSIEYTSRFDCLQCVKQIMGSYPGPEYNNPIPNPLSSNRACDVVTFEIMKENGKQLPCWFTMRIGASMAIFMKEVIYFNMCWIRRWNNYLNAYLWEVLIDIAYIANDSLYKLYTKMASLFLP